MRAARDWVKPLGFLRLWRQIAKYSITNFSIEGEKMAIFKGNKMKKESSCVIDDKKKARLNNDIQSWMVVLSRKIQTAVHNGQNSTYAIISESPWTNFGHKKHFKKGVNEEILNYYYDKLSEELNKDEYPFTAIELRIEESINDMLRLRIELSWGDEVPVLDTRKEIKNNSLEVIPEVLEADMDSLIEKIVDKCRNARTSGKDFCHMCLDNCATSSDLALNRNKLDKKMASAYYDALSARIPSSGIAYNHLDLKIKKNTSNYYITVLISWGDKAPSKLSFLLK